jgi:hypothetical protein
MRRIAVAQGSLLFTAPISRWIRGMLSGDLPPNASLDPGPALTLLCLAVNKGRASFHRGWILLEGGGRILTVSLRMLFGFGITPSFHAGSSTSLGTHIHPFGRSYRYGLQNEYRLPGSIVVVPYFGTNPDTLPNPG